MTLDNGIKQRQSERTRSALIDAATALLLEKGYEGTTLALLADHVGMTKGAIYHHFADKEALLRAVLDHIRRSWEREVGAHVPPAGDALERLGALFDHQAHLIEKEPSLCLLVTGLTLQSRALGRALGTALEQMNDDFTELVRGILADGQRAGTVRGDVAAKDLARSVVAIIKAISCTRTAEPSRNAFFTKMQTARTLVLSGLRRSAAEGRR